MRPNLCAASRVAGHLAPCMDVHDRRLCTAVSIAVPFVSPPTFSVHVYIHTDLLPSLHVPHLTRLSRFCLFIPALPGFVSSKSCSLASVGSLHHTARCLCTAFFCSTATCAHVRDPLSCPPGVPRGPIPNRHGPTHANAYASSALGANSPGFDFHCLTVCSCMNPCQYYVQYSYSSVLQLLLSL